MRNLAIRFSGAILWVGFFGLVLLAWGLLFWMQPGVSEPEMLRVYGADFWASLCAPLTAQSGFGAVFAMWALMSAAMMAPTFVPSLITYRDLNHTEAASVATSAALLAAYLTVWIGFSAVAAAAQLGLARLGLLGPTGASLNWGLSAVLLAGAGFYQFSSLKDACLSKCRAPLTYFMGHWRPGIIGAMRMGWHLGLICLGCCWALMSLGFVGGVMNLIWMGIATALMVVEKLPEIGRYVTKPMGFVFLAAAVFAGLQALEI